MDLTDIGTIKAILKENNLWANKALGQNFLVARSPLVTMIKSAKVNKNDTILEIGPGLGILTEELAKKAKLVLAVEKDYKLVEILRKRFKNYKNVKIIHSDILQYNNLAIKQFNNYKIVANLPYNITSPVIRKFLDSDNKPNLMVLMVQKEVANRLTAKPGDSDMGILTIMIALYGGANIIEEIPRTSFYPTPDVDSAIIKIAIKQNSKITIDAVKFMRLVKVGFGQKRRQIHHPLKDNLRLSKIEIFDILKKANIDPILRAEDLKLEDWINLYKIINKYPISNSKI